MLLLVKKKYNCQQQPNFGMRNNCEIHFPLDKTVEFGSAKIIKLKRLSKVP